MWSRAPACVADPASRSISDPVYSLAGLSHPCILRTLRPGAELRIGEDVGMNGATVCCAARVSIGSQVLMGVNALVTDTDFHALAPEGRRWSIDGVGTAPVIIGDNVWLGLNSVVLKGVTIGRDAVVGAGSVVVGDIPAGAMPPSRVFCPTWWCIPVRLTKSAAS